MKKWSILHFNSRSAKLINNKFVEISTEIIFHAPTIACKTETWLTSSAVLSMYSIEGYVSFFNSRSVKVGGGVRVLIREELRLRQLASDVTDNDSFNICAIEVDISKNTTLILCVSTR